MADATFTIGRLSAETGVHIETIRYYERIGLMPKPMRSRAGRRLYGAPARNRLGFVRRARELGFSIAEIRALLALSESKGRCADVHALTMQHLREVRDKIADLKKLERTLAGAAAGCARTPRPDCPIIEALSA
ncbi:MAG: helix-turn-helix domain-containing protein [Hyphomonadaceae bacterium]|nr:helix-turn-helix domain-containing protein [Hyphomonadaceae bacterium]